MTGQYWLIFLLLMFSLFLGWLLARFPPKSIWLMIKKRAWRQSYFRGLSFLLNEQTDHTIEDLLKSWDVNAENFDLHNALANMLRRKGEVDRAITIHGHLLAVAKSAKLSKSQIRVATIELASDYIKAGLLDRAERLLINVVNNSKDIEETALQMLLQVYQLEKDWDKAIVVAEQLFPHDRMSIQDRTLLPGSQALDIAHFYCEKASLALAQDDFIKAQQSIDAALSKHPSCARATLLQAELYFETNNKQSALLSLKALPEQDALLLVEALPILETYLSQEPSLVADLLSTWQKAYPSVAIEQALYQARLQLQDEQALPALEEMVRARPTLRGVDLFIDAVATQPKSDDVLGDNQNIALIHRLVKEVVKGKPTYQCRSCGFSGSQLHWQCPQCHQWDTIRRLRGAEGD